MNNLAIRRALLACGVLSSLLYLAMTVFVAMQWDAYSSVSQTVSELSAIDAPTRPLWVRLVTIYALLLLAFGYGVRVSAGRNRRLRVVGSLLVAHGIIGFAWPPMHQRAVLAAGGGTLTDILHIAWAMATVLLMMLAIGYGSAAFGKRFRLYSIATMVILLSFGVLSALDGAPDPGRPAHAVGRSLGAHQHQRVHALDRGAGHYPVATQTPCGRDRPGCPGRMTGDAPRSGSQSRFAES